MQPLNLKMRQSIALDVLSRFADYCKQNGFYYVLEFGTLLGAVRHKGFIPWDDDIDITMPREDYEKLIKNKVIDDHLIIDNYGDGNEHDTNFAKVYDDRTYAIKKNGQRRCGVYIDIYPMDYIPGKWFERRLQLFMLFYYYIATKLAEIPTRKANNAILQVVYNTLSFFYQMRGRGFYANKLNEVARNIKHKSSMMSVMIEPDKIGRRTITEEEYFKSIDVEFEGQKFRTIENYDYRLSLEYGDYMSLPPENQRMAHLDYNFYRVI